MRTWIDYYNSRFPEELFSPLTNIEDYWLTVRAGFKVSARSSVFIAALARDIEPNLISFLSRVERLRSFFHDSVVCVVENDSKDRTAEILGAWANSSKNVKLFSSVEDKQRLSDTSVARRRLMAEYRNKYLRQFLADKKDYLIVLDADLEGGYSYDGILHTIGTLAVKPELAGCGSNSIIYKTGRRLYYDSWALRIDNWARIKDEIANTMFFVRGQPVIKVKSAGGGLVVYRGSAISPNMAYTDEDCDCVTLARQLEEAGYSFALNPNMISLYTRI